MQSFFGVAMERNQGFCYRRRRKWMLQEYQWPLHHKMILLLRPYSTWLWENIQSLLGVPFATKASLVAQLVKNPPAMRETWIRSLGWEDPLEMGKATHSSILAWRIPWTIVHEVEKSLPRLSDFHFHC